MAHTSSSLFVNKERPDSGRLSYRASLLVQADLLERQLQQPANPDCAAVRALLGNGAAAPSWDRINEAELRLLSIMTDDMLQGEMPSQFQRAFQLQLSEAAELQQKGSDPATTPEFRRQMMMTLLRRMYLAFTERRIDRAERLIVDRRMMVFALTLVLVFVAAVVIAILPGLLPAWPLRPTGTGPVAPGAAFADIRWLIVAYMGCLGAMFSRFVEYRAQRIDLRWEALNAGYSAPVIAGRLLVGAFAALILYCVMAGNLLAGQMFLSAAATDTPPDLAAQIPAETFYRLMVWSVLAGFAERLVPDRLDELAASAMPKKS